jgi:hypothetical protein
MAVAMEVEISETLAFGSTLTRPNAGEILAHLIFTKTSNLT